MAPAKNFRELEIWKKGIELVKNIYDTTNQFPDREIYSLTSQIRRSAVSIPSNIAEGFRRMHAKEFQRFLSIALGSLAELETQVVIAKELSYIDINVFDSFLEKIDHLSRMIVNLIKKL